MTAPETNDRPPSRWRDGLAALVLVLLPLCFVGPSVFGASRLVPFDLARFPPAVTTMDPADVAAMMAQPSNLDASDTHAFLLPETGLARQQLEAGRFPAWNPGARFGSPLFANGLAALAYPPNWALLLADDPRDVLAFHAWFAFTVAGLSAFALLRHFGVATAGALFGGLAFAFCGTMLANAHYFGRMHSLVWLPAMLLCAARAGDEDGRLRPGSLLGLALCTALAWLAGFPPWAAIGTLTTAVFAVALVGRWWRRHGPAAGAWLGGALLGATVLGLGLAAVQLLPMFAFYPESNRDLSPAADVIAREAFDPMGFLGYVLPAPFGHPMPGLGAAYETSPFAFYLFSRRSWVDGLPLFPHNYDFAEYTVFPGSLVLVFAVVGLATCFRQRFQKFAVLMLLAFGTLAVAPAFLASFLSLPGVQNLQPMRWMGAACLFVAALAAIGLHGLVTSSARWRAFFAAGVAGSLAAVGFGFAWFTTEDRIGLASAIAEAYRPRLAHLTPEVVRSFLGDSLETGREWLHGQALHAGIAMTLAAVWLLLFPLVRRMRHGVPLFVLASAALTVLEMSMFATGVVANVRPSGRSQRDTEVHAFLRSEHERLADRGGITIARAAKAPKVPVDLPIGTLYADGIRDVQSFAFVDHWSHRLFETLWGEGQMSHRFWPNAFPDDARLAGPLLDVMGVRFLVGSEPLEHAGRRVGPDTKGPGGSFFVYERPHPMPRAFVVPALDVQPDDDAIVDRMCAGDFDPRHAVVVDSSAAARLGPRRAPDAAAAARPVRFTRDDPDDIVLSVAAGPQGYLVLADSFFSGWQATVDGQPATIARGNLFMRVLPLPEGASKVRFTYTPPGLVAGLVTTGLCLLISLALLVRALRRRREVPATVP